MKDILNELSMYMKNLWSCLKMIFSFICSAVIIESVWVLSYLGICVVVGMENSDTLFLCYFWRCLLPSWTSCWVSKGKPLQLGHVTL